MVKRICYNKGKKLLRQLFSSDPTLHFYVKLKDTLRGQAEELSFNNFSSLIIQMF